MKARQIIYSSTIIVLGFIQASPIFICLASTIILLNVLGIFMGFCLRIFGAVRKGQVVFPRAVAIHTPLGEFHPSWSLRDLESTIIVLGNI